MLDYDPTVGAKTVRRFSKLSKLTLVFVVSPGKWSRGFMLIKFATG
jgi:hypothetical protein